MMSGQLGVPTLEEVKQSEPIGLKSENPTMGSILDCYTQILQKYLDQPVGISMLFPTTCTLLVARNGLLCGEANLDIVGVP